MPGPLGLGALMIGGQALSSLFGPKPPEQFPSINAVGLPGQVGLLERMIGSYGRGQGEFGFGPAAQQGSATLRNMMGQRGISPSSGVYNSALAQMLAQAMGQDVNARRQFGLGLAQARPWTQTAHKFAGTHWDRPSIGVNRY